MKEPYTSDKNGRHHPNYRARGPKKFTYTYEEIAKTCGLSIDTLKNYNREIVSNIKTLASFIVQKKSRGSKILSFEELLELGVFIQEDKELWDNRYPLFNIYGCPHISEYLSHSECKGYSLSKGFCSGCSGGKDGIILKDNRFYVFVNNKYVPYSRLICEEPKGKYVFHKDKNSLNNRRDNLVCLTQQEAIDQGLLPTYNKKRE